ncbi:MAG: NAD(P)H-hydrate epimerase [candidate division KSB1 bacterium]|nr:NAD(P)H-hydrate epimerase [candidate division KSB1 bacterium]
MKTIATAKEMAAMDQTAIKDCKIPGVLLMENAGRGITDSARRMLNGLKGKTLAVFCGPGNNGGDGFVVARHCLNHGARVHAVRRGSRGKNKGGRAHQSGYFEKHASGAVS